MQSLREEVESEAFRGLPQASLDESLAPELAVLTRFTAGRMLRGKIERDGERWVWHFVLDTQCPHDGVAGIATSYELARMQMNESLRSFHVSILPRTDQTPPMRV
jgi:hypothetical protein